MDKTFHEYLIEMMGGLPIESLLEIGCGSGHNLGLIKAHWPETKLEGVDINIANRDRVTPLARFTVADLTQGLPMYEEDEFDAVLYSATLIYIRDDKQIQDALDMAKKIAKKYIMLVEAQREEEQWNHELVQMDYLKRLKDMGLKIIKKKDVSYWAQGDGMIIIAEI